MRTVVASIAVQAIYFVPACLVALFVFGAGFFSRAKAPRGLSWLG